ncbi:SP family sugar:H+ symporter-like MFS transporter [Arthrobacter sp. PvP102]|jgi:SP family sugar:H+ symporter-like MFS transporter|uniref:sugar porter family MFS transporter n=1 Tax=unclassified Arthrobacter TaxID=235627 RepID=UPI001AE201D3|nr:MULTISPECIES: sugar porter family MFS transporter [unclassified Arthrobacter]MBP1233380.1 SP family sugar:H+ symporter-like MFS transporter [Arthrobacter sp. PvP103]MBP1238515.1 SP family sugar:H+ symporter-like MFS transporter [Arthrobacter sp. PvP102]
MSTSSTEGRPGVPRKVIGLAIAGAVGGFLFGFDSSVVNGAVDAIKDEFALSEAVTGFAVAVALLGCAAGAFLAGKVADKYGRIPAMKLGAILFLVSAAGTGFAFGVWDLIFWRLVGGLGIGLASVIAPAYISEISPRHVRGRLASLQQLAITTGIFAALLSDALFANSAGGADQPLWLGLEAWRWMFLAGAVPAVVYGWIAYTLPESPRFLVFKGKEDEARKVFQTIAPAEDTDRHIREIQSAIEEDKLAGQKGSLRGKVFGLQAVVWIGITLSVLQQFVGINVIFYYSTTLWKAVGFQEKDSLTISVATSVTNILVTLVAIALVDRIGRRPILLAGSVGMAVSLGAMALAFASATGSGEQISLPGAWGPVALVAANVFVVSFGASWGPLVWVLLGEIFPSRIRARALGLAAAAQWIANFAITLSFPVMAAASLPLTYAMYALFAAASFFFVMFKVPETNGMSLEQAETLFVPKGTVKV